MSLFSTTFSSPNPTANSPVTPLANGAFGTPGAPYNGEIKECSLTATSGNWVSLGTVAFPIEECSVNFSQDLAQHKRPNVPGARIESTGFNPLVFRVKAPFLQGLQRAKGETWDNLFPTTFINVFQILTDQVSPVCTFVHPTLGQFTVKPISGSTTTTATIRNGQILEFELVQANEDDTTLSNITSQDEFGTALAAASLFDEQLTLLIPAPPKNITSINLTQLLQKVRGTIDQTTLFINQATSTINNAIFQVKMIEDSLSRLDTAATSGLQMQLTRVKAGLYGLLPGASKQQSKLGVYFTPGVMTLASVAAVLHVSVDQLIKLNPAIATSANLLPNTQVVYPVK